MRPARPRSRVSSWYLGSPGAAVAGYPGPFNDVDVFGGLSVRELAVLIAHQDAQAGSAQNDHRAGRVRDDVLAHRAKQHAREAPVSA